MARQKTPCIVFLARSFHSVTKRARTYVTLNKADNFNEELIKGGMADQRQQLRPIAPN